MSTEEKPKLTEPTVVNEELIDMSKISTESRGEKLVGITFNPSGDNEVNTVGV